MAELNTNRENASANNSILSPETFEILQKHINLHRVLVVLTVAIYFIAWNRGLALLYGLFSLLLAILLLSYCLPYYQLRKINIHRRQVADLFVGEKQNIEYQFQSSSRRYQLKLVESLPLLNMNSFSFNSEIIKTNAVNEVTFTRRGCFNCAQVSLSSAYPFGIFEYSKTINIQSENIIVFPKRIELTTIPMPMSAENLSLGDVSVFQKGGHDDFLGVRDYIRGDELNRIHWSASAKQGQLVVKEYERYDHPAILLVLNCQQQFEQGSLDNNSYEKAISLAAAIISFASRSGMQSYLVADDGDANTSTSLNNKIVNKQAKSMTIPAMENDLNALYELLANLGTAAPDDLSKTPYQNSCDEALNNFPDANLIFTFRLDDEPSITLPDSLSNIELVFEKNSFLNPHHLLRQESKVVSASQVQYVIGANTPLETLFNAL